MMTQSAAAAIFQTSTMGALLSGAYEGRMTVRELLCHGDIGLGTFNDLDGEMLVLDGICYRLLDDGSVVVAHPDDRTPFAAVTWFRPEQHLDISAPCDRAELMSVVDQALASTNLMVAIRVKGLFERITTRAVAKQQLPDRPFTEVTRDQQEATFTDVTGTLAGFRMPAFEQGISVAGYHSHFIDGNLRHGGHALDYRLAHGRVDISVCSDLHLSLPRTPQFLHANLNIPDIDQKIRQSEENS
jgi:acetolactate decarboxylase